MSIDAEGEPFLCEGPPGCPHCYEGKGLYADKCEECTTGLSCEEASQCLFEG